MNLPQELNIYIIQYLDFVSVGMFMKASKPLLNTCYLDFRNKLIKKYFPKYILDIINYKNQYPLIKYKTRFIGVTHYIDKIYVKDIDSKIMVCVDHFKRPFITFRLQVDHQLIIYTIFQRYTLDPNTWTSGTAYPYHDIFGYSRLNKDSYTKIQKCIQSNKIGNILLV